MSHQQKISVKDVSPKAGVNQFDPETGFVDLYAKHKKIHPRHQSGFFQRIRHALMLSVLAAYFFAPWLTWNDRQAILFDLPTRNFYIFGFTFAPQDFLFLSWILMIAAFALFFVTVFAGRVWCGYTCPQTVWTWLFVEVERLFEGDRNQRMKLDNQPMSANKFVRKGLKHALWMIIAFATAAAFVGYFTPIRELFGNLVAMDLDPWGWFWLAFFTLMTYLNAGWMREQVCFYMCPYARFQSAMYDHDTLAVSYDAKRGEPRGARKKNAEKTNAMGDCVNCQLCVQVCPTGIDIRDGLQYECIGCGACVDACDSIMDQMGYPRGLVRYTSENVLDGKPRKILRPRLVGYGIILLALSITFIVVLAGRVPVEFSIAGDRTQIYHEDWEGTIEESYDLKILNKTQAEHSYRVTFSGIVGLKAELPQQIIVKPGQLVTVSATLEANKSNLTSPNMPIKAHLEAIDDPTINVDEETRFISPVK